MTRQPWKVTIFVVQSTQNMSKIENDKDQIRRTRVKEKERKLKNLLQVALREVENQLSNTRNMNGISRTCTPQFSVQIISGTYETITENN